MLGAIITAAWRARPAISVRCAAVKPVVPMTARAPVSATRRRWDSVASGVENSTRIRSRVMAAAGSLSKATPRRPRPAASPASRPSAGWPGASRAATTRRSGESWTQATMREPIRPAAPATTTPVGTADARPRSGAGAGPLPSTLMTPLLHETVRLENRPQLVSVGVAHAAHRETELRLDHAGHGHGFLDRDRVRLQERRAREREEPIVQLPRPLPVSIERRVNHVGGVTRDDVGDHGDDAAASDGEER